MIAFYVVISGACCLVAGFLIGLFAKRPASQEVERLKSDLEKKEEAFSSLKEEKEQTEMHSQLLEERCRNFEERIKEFDSRLEKEQEAVQKREDDLRSSIREEFETNRSLQKEAENRTREDYKDRDQTQKEILKALTPLESQLSSLRDKLASIEENRSEEVGELKGSIEGLKSIEHDIQEEAHNLSSLMNNNQLRGRWGEIQLQNLIEKCGMEEHVDFKTQLSLSSKAKQGTAPGRPDLVILFPGKCALPVDAKTPIEKFKEVDDEGKPDPTGYAKVIRELVKTLSGRNYPKLLSENDYESLNFTVAYIPVASWLQEAIKADPDLLDYAFSQNVVLCSAVSFWALLQAVRVSWKNFHLQEEAQDIEKDGEDLYESLIGFYKYLDKLRSGLKNALDSYNSMVGNVESRLVPRSKKLGNKVGQKDFQKPNTIEEQIRVIKQSKGKEEE